MHLFFFFRAENFSVGILQMQISICSAQLLCVALVLLGLCLTTMGTPSLDESNFEEQVFKSGKNAFVKFFAPW